MARIEPGRIRNVALLGHSHEGKTSLAEAMLYAGGGIERLGRPESGTTTFDFEPEEIKRKISIGTAVAHLTWKDHKINLLDTPGFQDFVGDVHGALRVAEGALLVVGAGSGAVVGTELAWTHLRDASTPTLVVVNKMDKENADYWKAVDSMREFSPRPVAIQAPIGEEATFKGVIDLVTRKAYSFDAQGHASEIPIPAELAAEVEGRRSPLVEAAAETDDALLEKYLETGELTDTELTAALAKGVAAGTVVPVLCAASAKSIGIGTLLDAIVALLPSPISAVHTNGASPGTEKAETVSCDPAGPPAALVFKTTADPFVGRISYVKVVSGVLNAANHALTNTSKDQPERIGSLGFPKGKVLEPATEVVAGDIAGISKLHLTSTGETLSTREHPVHLPRIEYPAWTYSAAVGAKNKADEEKVNAALVKLVDEDPTLTLVHEPITKESILQGMGDVHLDVVLEKMKRK
ncbi:MAG: GTP-binding protein, partial [Candidatus Dormibacteraeota bacterium]|nr:GTP-binding protein [Candidatus Dormibacteraeota bacterium]